MGRTFESPSFSKIWNNFNSLAPCGANPRDWSVRLMCEKFQLTRPVWGEPCPHMPHIMLPLDFNSLAPCGANHFGRLEALWLSRFQLTRPVWGEPLCVKLSCMPTNISTHSPRVGRTIFAKILYFSPKISTHSPRVGRTPGMLR